MWGYYETLDYVDKDGRARQEIYSRYGDNHLFGAPGRGKSASINFGLDNNLEMKVRHKTDSIEEYKKISLIDNFSLNSSYNLAADSFQLADINASISIRLSQSLNINLSGSFDPYLYGHTTDGNGYVTPHRVNKLRIFNGKGFGSLRGTGTSFSYTFNNQTFEKIKGLFTGKKDKKDKDKDKDSKTDSLQNDPNGPRPDGKDTSLADIAAKKQERKSLFGNKMVTSRSPSRGISPSPMG